tara:strand:- start:707 stop:895 length:189 start_codon:yes stop_codon:yes gene_type:complete
MKTALAIYLIVVIACIFEGYFCTKEMEEIEEDEEEKSECCGATFIEDYDICPKCLEHTGRKI